MEPQLLQDYDSLFSNPYIREGMKMVIADNSEEKLLDNRDNFELDNYIKSGLMTGQLTPSRLEIKRFINKYFFNNQNYNDTLWYERLFSFEKFMIIAMKLESYNLMLMNVNSDEFRQNIYDIPQSYIRFAAMITDARNRWNEIKNKCKLAHESLCEKAQEYRNIYLNTRM